MDVKTNQALFMEWLEKEVFRLMEQKASTKPWTQVDKTKLPKEAFLWVVDPEKKSTWKLPYREGAGGLNEDTGNFNQAGPVNLGALRAIASAIAGAKTGQPMTIPSEIRRKIVKLLKRYKIGSFREDREMLNKGTEILEYSLSNQFVNTNLDKEGCVIRNVTILSPTSANKTFKESIGRRYSRKAREEAARLVTGAKAYINHATRKELEERGGVRDVRDILGYHQNGRLDEDGIVRSDLVYLENHKPWIEPLVEKMADKIGNSVHCTGDLSFDRGSKYEIVENLTELRSVDLVTDTGATRSLFESLKSSEEEDMDYAKLTLKELQENRPDILESISNGVKSQIDKEGKGKKLEAELVETKKTITDQKKKIDDFEVKEKAKEKEERILELINEAKIKKDYVTEPFMESLRIAKDEEAVKALIEDRRKLVQAGKSGGVKGMGDEREIKESEEKIDPEKEKAAKAELEVGILE